MEIPRYKTPAGFNGVANRLAGTGRDQAWNIQGSGWKTIHPVVPVHHFLFVKPGRNRENPIIKVLLNKIGCMAIILLQ